MKPAHMLKVLDTCKYQISREGLSKPDAGSKVAAGPVAHKRESAVTA